MKLLKELFYLLVFPGFIFSTMLGFLLAGIDRKIVAKMQRRKGPKITQPIFDFLKLLGKDTIIPRNANEILFILAPIIALVSIAVIPILIPIGNSYFISGTADIVVIIYLLVFPAVCLVIGGMASSSPFASIGVSREVVTMIAYELPLITSILAVCKKAGIVLGIGTTYSMAMINKAQQLSGSFMFSISLLPAAIAFLMIIPAKVGVSPFDVSEAETELCEGPLVEYSGLHLSLFKLTHNIKIYVMAILFVALFLGNVSVNLNNGFLNILINTIIALILVIIIVAVCLSIVRGSMGRYRTQQMFKFYWTIPTVLSLISYILVSCNI